MITDEALIRALVASVAKILVCLVCLFSATWAFFATPTPTADEDLKAELACLLSVTVSAEGETDSERVDILTASVRSPQTKLLQSGSYTVTMTLPRDSATGYLVISVGDTEYRAEYIERHAEEEPRTVAFTLTLNDSADVTFTPRLGVYSAVEPSVRNGDTLTVN